MNPQARAALDALLRNARATVVAREQKVREASDGALCRVLGIPDAAAARRIATTPRVARRIAEELSQVVAEEEQRSLGALLAKDLPTNPDDVRLVDGDGTVSGVDGAGPIDASLPAPDGERLMRMIAAAIRLNSTGALLTRNDLEGALNLHGAEAVDFGLANRSQVPNWMHEAAGGREDLHRQLAASCVLALAETLPVDVAESLRGAMQSHEPLQLGAGAARLGAERLAQRAVDFAATYGPSPVGDPAGTH